jgi:potassium-dependent mechanosensitive channel
MHVLERPIASALLVGLMLTPSFYPNSSVFIGELAALAVIVPLLRLLPRLVYAPMRRPLYALAALYTLSRLHTLAIPRSGLDRLLLLVVALLALAGLVVLLRPGARTIALSTSRWWRWAVVVARVAALALAAALVANVAGAVALSEMLVEATLASALVGAILLAVVLVLAGLLTILLRTRRARALRSVDRYGSVVEARVRRVLSGAALVVWLVTTALLLNVGGSIWNGITSVLNASWQRGTVDLSLGDVLAFLAGVWLALLVSRFIRFVLEEDVLPRLPLARGVPNTITMLVNYCVIGLGFMLALAAAGVDLTRLTIIAGALSVGVGFGLQNIVNNFVSGLILAFERPVQVGDLIEAGTMVGRVTRIGIRSSTIRTGSGAEVIVPNANLVSNDVVNWTLSDRERKVELKVGVAYGNDPAKVVALLHDAVASQERIASNPVPVVTFDGFGDSALAFTVRCWGKTDELLRTGSDVAIAVNAALTEAGIEIPYPQRDLRVRAVEPEAAAALRGSGPA